MQGEEIIRLEGLTKWYEDGHTVLDHIDLSIRRNEFLTLLGPSGCGKTTTLRLIAGFETPSEGRILFDGQDIHASKRKVCFTCRHLSSLAAIKKDGGSQAADHSRREPATFDRQSATGSKQCDFDHRNTPIHVRLVRNIILEP